MIVIGMDLSGPSNIKDTAVVAFRGTGKGLCVCNTLLEADDRDILTFITALGTGERMVAGIDAPLSYNPGGGDRPGDSKLRKKIVSAGMKPGSIMPPTMNRMVYLTLRGMSVVRLLLAACDAIKIAEIHPGGALAMGGAPVEDVKLFKKEKSARIRLLRWMAQQGLHRADEMQTPSDHYVAACAAAFGAWKWYLGKTAWLHRAEPPFHPFDYAC